MPHVSRAAATEPAAVVADSFDIGEYRILGNHVLPVETIERAVYPFLGPQQSLETVKQAVAALEKAYRDAGYGAVYVDIPEQKVDEGIVRLQVTEGQLDHLRVRGERYVSGREILAALPSLRSSQTPNLPQLQQELTQLNAQTPDRAVVPVLKAGQSPGTLDIDLNVTDKLPLHGGLDYDNRHAADTTPNRATASLSYDNLWQRHDSIGLQYQTAPARTGDAQVFVGNYRLHLTDTGAQAAFSYIHTNSNVLALNTLGVLGKGSIYGGRLLLSLPGDASRTQSLSLGVDYKDVLTLVLPDPVGGTSGAAVATKVHYANWLAQYASFWQLERQSYSLSLSLGLGLRSLLNSTDVFSNARYNGNPNYLYARAALTATQQLSWGFSLEQRVNGQWANSPLVNNEQFALGGVDSVRGYLEAETLGDSGAALSLEIHSPSPGDHFWAPLARSYFYVFVDGGVATLVDPLPSQHSSVVLWSAGVGLRLEMPAGFAGSLDYALPRREGLRTHKDERHVDFALHYRF